MPALRRRTGFLVLLDDSSMRGLRHTRKRSLSSHFFVLLDDSSMRGLRRGGRHFRASRSLVLLDDSSMRGLRPKKVPVQDPSTSCPFGRFLDEGIKTLPESLHPPSGGAVLLDDSSPHPCPSPRSCGWKGKRRNGLLSNKMYFEINI